MKDKLCIFVLLLMTACTPLTRMAVPTEHIVMFDSFGKPLNPTTNFWWNHPVDPGINQLPTELLHTDFALSYPEESYAEYEAHLDKIIKKMDEFNKGKSVKKLLLFIHGGLNTQVGSIERVVEKFDDGYCEPRSECKTRYERIKDAGYFPLFINWKSSLISSYWENLFWLRQGESQSWTAPFTSPFVFATDIGRSLLRWPIVSGNLITNDISTIPSKRSSAIGYPDTIAKELICRYQYSTSENNIIPESYKNKWTYQDCLVENKKTGLKFRKAPWPCPFDWDGLNGNNTPESIIYINNERRPKTFPLRVGDDERECGELLTNFALYLPTLPAKLLTTPIVDAFGTSSWDVMLRHVDLLFHSENELRSSELTNQAKFSNYLSTLPSHGGLSILLNKLADKLKEDNSGTWEITLVGHSMGVIVTNQLIRNFGSKLPIKNIIYLAAATSVHDYEDTVYPYLLNNHNRKMYHFMLHPRAEEGESMGFELASRGSLLVWIDSFLSKPLSPMDRTVGRYDNLFPALHNADDSIREQIYLRVYRAGNNVEDTDPQTHSDVAARFKFWEEDCWQSNSTTQNCIIP